VRNRPQYSTITEERAWSVQDIATALKFEKADKNGDGFLDETELALAVYPELDAEMLNLVTGLVLKHKDDNKDGKVSLTEWQDNQLKHFETLEDESLDREFENFVKKAHDFRQKEN